MRDRFVLTRGMLILIILFILLIAGIIIGISTSKSNSIEEYKNFENQLESMASKYYEIKGLDLDEGEEIKIELSSLDKQIPITNDLKNKCDGYIIIANELNIEKDEYELTYNSYIKCGRKYITNNYSEY